MISEKAIRFFTNLKLTSSLPDGVEVLNPYRKAATRICVKKFYDRYYADLLPRVGVFGINPGRFGAGLTGLSFTDPVALRESCGIDNELGNRKELSSEYVYKCIAAFGGTEKFFGSFYLSALCPLGFVKGEINYNFYDDAELQKVAKPFIIESIASQIGFPLRTDVAICFGTGKLKKIFTDINTEYEYFERIMFLEHPRFIMQYKRKQLSVFIEKYESAFEECMR